MNTVQNIAAPYESPARTWELAELHAPPCPEFALQDALEFFAWRDDLTPESVEAGYAFARKHDLWEQESDAMAERIEQARAAVAAAKISELEKERERMDRSYLKAVPKPPLSPEEEDLSNATMIAKLSGQTVAEVQAEAARNAAAQALTKQDFTRGDHVELGGRLLTVMRMRAQMTFTEGQFYRYASTPGIFETVLGSELSRSVQTYAGNWVTTKKRSLALKSSDVKGTISLAADQADDPEFFADARQGIAFVGSFVEVTAEGIRQHESSPEHRARVAYDFEFNPAAMPTEFLKMLCQIFRDDADRDDKISFIQEHAGMCLIGCGNKYQKVALHSGKGSNGKSALSNIIERCFPAAAVVAIPPQDLDDDYKRAKLVGARVNLVGEVPENEIHASEPWKAVVDGLTKISARSPYKDVFFFKPTAGHIYSANRLPGTNDHTLGFWRRWVVIEHNRTFEEHEKDAGLPDRIVAKERPAIVAWLLRGARRALANGRYTIPPSSDAAVAKWQGVADQVSAYVEAECERLKEGAPFTLWTKSEAVFQNYQAWALRSGHRPMSIVKFGERMQGLRLGSSRQTEGCRYPVKLV